jgi:hypothetical protein
VNHANKKGAMAMQTFQVVEKTDKDGALSLRVPLGQPETEFEVVVILQPKAAINTTTPNTTPLDLDWVQAL